MKLVFLGPPGVGKGTQAKELSVEKSLVHISTGDMLRAAVAEGTELGQKVKAVMDAGQLVSDALIVDLIKERTAKSDCSNGYILDGFPRTLAQGEALEEMLVGQSDSLDKVVLFSVSKEAVIKRLKKRREEEGRVDDSEETQLERMKVYEDQTAPLVDFYQAKGLLVEVDASGDIDQVKVELASVVS